MHTLIILVKVLIVLKLIVTVLLEFLMNIQIM